MNSNDVLISIKNLKKNFNKLEVLKGIDLDIHKSEVISIIGASGSGKSTLIRCLNFLEMPSSGSIIYDGNISILKIINCLKILFCLRKVKKFSSIDYNNAYLTHALASKNDFITEDDIGKSFDQSISYKS